MDLAGSIALAGAQHYFSRRSSLAYKTRPPFCCRGRLLYRLDHERMGRYAFLLSCGNSPLLEFVRKL